MTAAFNVFYRLRSIVAEWQSSHIVHVWTIVALKGKEKAIFDSIRCLRLRNLAFAIALLANGII